MFIEVAEATKMAGRFYLGGYGSTERFSDFTTGSDKNDFMISSSRFFLKLSEMGTDQEFESTLDIRDTYDFFDKLDRSTRQLNAQNTMQARQAYVRYLNSKSKWGATGGRFPVIEAGSVSVDGGLLEYRINRDWNAAAFGGHNSKRIEQKWVQNNPDSTIYGTYFKYEPKLSSWEQNFLVNHSLVTEKYLETTERTFLFQNIIYQWEEQSRFMSLAYFDFVPDAKVQTANLIWQQQLSKIYNSELDLIMMDVNEYYRRQNLLEKLDPSPYAEARGKLDYHLSDSNTMGVSVTAGRRSYDGLNKTELAFGYGYNKIWSYNWDLVVHFGVRKNYTSQDEFVRSSLGYFSRIGEANLNADYSIQNNSQYASVTHPLLLEMSLNYFVSKSLALSGSFQREADERVTIYSAFFKLGYRFGSHELPPLRDGAPPRGQL